MVGVWVVPGLFEFRFNLVYVVSSRPAKAAPWDPDQKKKITQKALLNKRTTQKKEYSVFVIRQYLRMATLNYGEDIRDF